MMTESLLRTHLAVQVPLYIGSLLCGERPWPSQERLHELGAIIAAKGDRLLFGGGRAGEVAQVANALGLTVALLAFCPGGVRVFGDHYEVPQAEVSAYFARRETGAIALAEVSNAFAQLGWVELEPLRGEETHQRKGVNDETG